MPKEILAINPPIYDFSAYDLWLKPYGFLHILSLLKEGNIKIKFLDCLDRFHPLLEKYDKKISKTNPYGCGKFLEEKVEKPTVLNWVPRYYRRYGLPKDLIRNFLKGMKPDLILITSSMSYWYLGIKEMINILRDKFPSIPIILGGTYATICYDHAVKNLKADFVIKSTELENFAKLAKKLLNIEMEINDLYQISPCYDFYPSLHYIVIRTSWGCPFNCSYCGIKLIQPEFIERNIENVFGEIKEFYLKGIKNIAFYDDALLYHTDRIKYLLRKTIKENIVLNFHTPNGLHARFIDQELAKLMYQVKFINPRLSLESIDEDFQKNSGAKVFNYEIEKAVYFLKKAGYKDFEYSIYLLIGLPQENLETIRKSIEYVKNLKAKPLLAEYSPIPNVAFLRRVSSGSRVFGISGTEISKKIKHTIDEPLFHNNSIFPAYELKDWKKLQELKELAREY
jgi:radical SAM superfamily enzyme YgiQ (UPF0313 family)